MEKEFVEDYIDLLMEEYSVRELTEERERILHEMDQLMGIPPNEAIHILRGATEIKIMRRMFSSQMSKYFVTH